MFSVIIPDHVAVSSIFDSIPRGWSVIDCRPLIDGDGNTRQLVDDILLKSLEVAKSGHRICFACDYGHSRSNLLAALFIRNSFNKSLEEAIALVRDKHPESAIKQSLINGYDNKSKLVDCRKYAVTGASSLVGRMLQKSLELYGYSVLGLSRSMHGAYLKDINQLSQVLADEHVTDIIHLAHPQPFNSYATSIASMHHLYSLLEYCTDFNCRLHYISSWVVFDGYAGSRADETIDPKPYSLHAQSKALQEKSIIYQGEGNGLQYHIYRLPGIFSRQSLDPRFLRYFIDCARTKQDIVVHEYENGSAVVPLVDLDDSIVSLADAIQETSSSNSSEIKHLSYLSCNLSISDIALKMAQRYNINVQYAPVSRKIFTGNFTTIAEPRGSPTDNDQAVLGSKLFSFIEDLVNV